MKGENQEREEQQEYRSSLTTTEKRKEALQIHCPLQEKRVKLQGAYQPMQKVTMIENIDHPLKIK